MSVRRSYNLLLDGRVIASGSYKSIMDSYHSALAVINTFNINAALTISFVPV